MFDERAALRAAAALDVDDVFHVTTDLFERFPQYVCVVRLAQKPVKPRQVDVHYRHSATSPIRLSAPGSAGGSTYCNVDPLFNNPKPPAKPGADAPVRLTILFWN